MTQAATRTKRGMVSALWAAQGQEALGSAAAEAAACRVAPAWLLVLLQRRQQHTHRVKAVHSASTAASCMAAWVLMLGTNGAALCASS